MNRRAENYAMTTLADWIGPIFDCVNQCLSWDITAIVFARELEPNSAARAVMRLFQLFLHICNSSLWKTESQPIPAWTALLEERTPRTNKLKSANRLPLQCIPLGVRLRIERNIQFVTTNSPQLRNSKKNVHAGSRFHNIA